MSFCIPVDLEIVTWSLATKMAAILSEEIGVCAVWGTLGRDSARTAMFCTLVVWIVYAGFVDEANATYKTKRLLFLLNALTFLADSIFESLSFRCVASAPGLLKWVVLFAGVTVKIGALALPWFRCVKRSPSVRGILAGATLATA